MITLELILIVIGLTFFVIVFVFMFLSYELGLCFVTGKTYKGKLLSLKPKDINRRRMYFVKALESPYPILKPEWTDPGNAGQIIWMNAFFTGTLFYTLPIGSLLEKYAGSLNTYIIFVLAFGPIMALMLTRLYRPIGLLRPFWMKKYLK